jgi:hypothetical protein
MSLMIFWKKNKNQKIYLENKILYKINFFFSILISKENGSVVIAEEYRLIGDNFILIIFWLFPFVLLFLRLRELKKIKFISPR